VIYDFVILFYLIFKNVYRYKWSKEMLSEHIVPKFGVNVIPPFYYTPPYLTAKPQVAYHHLQPRDKFLILATDGLWDFMTPLQVIQFC